MSQQTDIAEDWEATDTGVDIAWHQMSILVIDDEPSVCEFIELVLEPVGFQIQLAGSVSEARALIAVDTPDIALVDKNLPDGSGLDFAREAMAKPYRCTTIVMTAFGNMKTVIAALRMGASDYLTKPFPDPEFVRNVVMRAAKVRALQQHNEQLLDQLRTSNEELRSLAVRDPLTKLFNHARMQDHLHQAITESALETPVSLLLLDMIEFKRVNDELGHVTGDRALQAIAEIIKTTTEAQGPAAMAARYGGDLFALTLPGVSKGEGLRLAAEVVAAVEGHAFDVLGLPDQRVRVGVATYPNDAKDRDGLIHAADVSLFASKHGQAPVVGYTPSLVGMRTKDAQVREVALRQARAVEDTITNQLFHIVYQPIVDSATGSAYALEALCRTEHDDLKSPLDLIRAAEATQQIAALGRSLRINTVRGMESLPANSTVFINLHPHELENPEFVAVESFMAQWAEQVVFEITEVAELNDFGKVRDVMARFRQYGFRFALDDLGAGYSGLAALATLEPDFVKLDRALMLKAKTSARARRLIRHIVEFCDGETTMAIAEGVETEDEWEMVRSLGARYVQGYLFARPMKLDQLSEWLGN